MEKGNLAMAYAMKRRMGKKMASGGMMKEKYDEGGEVSPEKVEGDMATKPATAMDSSEGDKKIDKAAPVAEAKDDSSGGNEASAGSAGAEALSAGVKGFGEGLGGEAIKNGIDQGMSMLGGSGGGGGGGMSPLMLAALAHGGIAHMIMKKKMAEGGMVDHMGLQDQEYDPDRFLSENMADGGMNDKEDDDMDPKSKRKSMIASIMDGLHARHYGR